MLVAALSVLSVLAFKGGLVILQDMRDERKYYNNINNNQ